MLRTGITTSAYYKRGTTECDYEKMASHGYSCADYSGIANPDAPYYSMNDDELRAAMQEEVKKASAAGIEIFQVHGTWPVRDTTAEETAHNLEGMKTCVRATSFLGTKYLIVHPLMPYEWNEEKDPDYAEKINEDFFRELCTYALDWNVCICIENMPTKKHRLAGIPNLVEFVKRLNFPNFFICIDTGHCNIAGHDAGEMVTLCGDLLKTFHIHDNSGFRDEHFLPFGGTINWESFRSALGKSSFEGSVSIESSLNRFLPPDLKERQQVTIGLMAKYLAEVK